jgi:hypothetical protein
MPGIGYGAQRRRGKFRRTHEDDAKGHEGAWILSKSSAR